MKRSGTVDLENTNRSASIGGSSDNESARRGRDQIAAIWTECDGPAANIRHFLLVKHLSRANVDEVHRSGSVDADRNQPAIGTEGWG
jgi:hypothetical protein